MQHWLASLEGKLFQLLCHSGNRRRTDLNADMFSPGKKSNGENLDMKKNENRERLDIRIMDLRVCISRM